MRSPTRLEVVMLLEKRIVEFVESVTMEPAKPKVVLTPSMLAQEKLGKLIMVRLIKAKFLKEHLKDDHVASGCNLCDQIVSQFRWDAEAKANDFLNMNRELLAELSLTDR